MRSVLISMDAKVKNSSHKETVCHKIFNFDMKTSEKNIFDI